jgi:hypothetical protein
MESNGRRRKILFRAAICFMLLPAIAVLALKPKGKKPDDSSTGENAGDAADTLPASLTLASMRVSAMDTLYQLDLSKEQLTALREAATGAAEDEHGEPAPGNKPALRALFVKLQAALVAGTDDASISSLRNQVVELVNSKDIELNDTVRPTSAAHAAAAKVLNSLTASQLAAYIAAHADDVGDPIELMNNGLTSMREAKTATQPDSEVDDIATETSSTVAVLVAGMDGAKANSVAEQVSEWLKTNAQLSEADFNAGEKKRDADAHQITGSIGPSDVLTHWMQEQIAVLLSNPQAIRAIDLMSERKPND